MTVERLVVSSENLEEAFAAFPDSQALPLGPLSQAGGRSPEKWALD